MYKKNSQNLLQFLKKSPTAFHAVENMRQELLDNGYQELLESEHWHIEGNQKYFVTRNQSSIIAFHTGDTLNNYSFHIVSSHSDSPTFKIKENSELQVNNQYMKLNVEPYGGMLCATWFDKPLSIAGRVLVKKDNQFIPTLLNFDRDLVLIPNVAIHMNRGVNDGYAYNQQVDMLPLFGGNECQSGDFRKLIAEELNVKVEVIYGTDLYLYNRTDPTIWGVNEEFISSGRIDDLQCAYTSLQAFLNSYNKENINVFACFDNEEVGSQSKQGAGSTLLFDVLKRINLSLNKTEEDFYCALASSFMVSADNAHAVHPNHPELTDTKNCVYMNEGIVIKSHAGQKYTSDATSVAIFKSICESVNVPLQFFANRSDKLGGSTLGNIAMSQVSMNSVDIGLPQLAMHSSYETAGIKDTYYMIQALTKFYNCHIEEIDNHVLKVVQ